MKKVFCLLAAVLLIGALLLSGIAQKPAADTSIFEGATTTIAQEDLQDNGEVALKYTLYTDPDYDRMDASSLVLTYNSQLLEYTRVSIESGRGYRASGSNTEAGIVKIVMSNMDGNPPDADTGYCVTVTVYMRVLDAQAIIDAGGAQVAMDLNNYDYTAYKGGRAYTLADKVAGIWEFDMVVELSPMVLMISDTEPVSYTISFDSNGGDAVNDITVELGKGAQLPTPERDGYDFAGWYSDAALTKAVTSPYTPTADIKLYADWTEQGDTKEYWIISFQTNGGNAVDSLSVEKGESAALPTPERDGYDFAGWYSDAGLTAAVSSPYTPASNLTLYADWTETAVPGATWSVSFDTNGGDAIDAINVEQGKSAILPTPTKDGSNFDGWYSDSGLTQAVSSPYTPTADSKLYAKWEEGTTPAETWTITLNTNGGDTLENLTVEQGKSAVLPTPTRAGYTFGGWYSNSSLTKAVASPYTPTANATLYAKWTPEIGSESASVVKGATTTLKEANVVDGYRFNLTFTIYVDPNYDRFNAGNIALVYHPDVIAPEDVSSVWGTNGYDVSGSEMDDDHVNLTVVNMDDAKHDAEGKATTITVGMVVVDAEALLSAGSAQVALSLYNNDFSIVYDGVLYSYYEVVNDIVDFDMSVSCQPMTVEIEGSAAKTWTVSFDANGGDQVDSVTVEQGKSAVLPTPSRNGYTFDGWHSDSGLTQKVSSPYTPAANVTLYAKWKEDAVTKEYWTISFDSGGGSTVGSITVEKGKSTALPTPTLAGYTFNGWHSDAGLTVTVASPFTPTSNVTLYADWVDDSATVEYWTVSFETNGGSAIEAVQIQKGKSTVLPTPTREGHTFSGWHSDAGLTTDVASPYTPASNVTLYADWEADAATEYWTIAFQSNGGSSVGSITVEKGESATLPTPSRSNYTFNGWYADSSFSTLVSSPYAPTANITLYAKWTYSGGSSSGGGTTTSYWTVTFDSNGGSSVSSVRVVRGAKATLPDPTRSGYTFDGWYTDQALTSKVTSPYTPSSNITLYAGWTEAGGKEETTYTVKYNSGGGTAVDASTVKAGESITLPAPTRDGYTFDGWYSDQALTNKVVSPYTPTADITLHAGWTENGASVGETYTVKYSTNGGDAIEDTTVKAGESITLPTPTRDGYTFTSWYADADLVQKVITPYKPTGDVTLYAGWTQDGGTVGDTYTVKYNTNGGNGLGDATVKAGETITLPTPLRSGYTFAGWYTDEGLKTKITEKTYTPTSDITLHAKWTANTATPSVPKTGLDGTIFTLLIALGGVAVLSAGIVAYKRYKVNR